MVATWGATTQSWGAVYLAEGKTRGHRYLLRIPIIGHMKWNSGRKAKEQLWNIHGQKWSACMPLVQNLWESNIMLLFEIKRSHYSYSKSCRGHSVHFEQPVVLFWPVILSVELMLKWWEPARGLFWSCGIAPFPHTKQWLAVSCIPLHVCRGALSGSSSWQLGDSW